MNTTITSTTGDIRKVFGAISDLEWLDILIQSLTDPVIAGVALPRFPDASIQAQFVGSANENALREAFNFYVFFKEQCSRLSLPISAQSTFCDFGVGWGRFLRLFCKDIDTENLFGIDIDPDIITLCRETGLPGTLSVVDPRGKLPFSDARLSHLIAYSVFTHLPDDVHRHWLLEIARTVCSGGIVTLTLEPRRFLDFVQALPQHSPPTGWHAAMSAYSQSVPALLQQFDAGELVYLPTGGGPHRDALVYGDAVVPLAYIERHWGSYFEIDHYLDDPDRFWQAVLVMRRR